jgi:hypothetical protein
MPVFGVMPVEWSGALDPGQIWGDLGFFFLTFPLLWLELQVVVKNTVPFNKAYVCGHRSGWRRGADELLLASRGGEGKKQAGAPISASGRWRGRSLLQIGENHTMALVATVICDRKGGLSKSLLGVSSTSSAEALLKLLAGSPLLLVAKWLVPGDVKLVGEGSLHRLEKTQVSIAFLFRVSGSLVQNYRTMLYFTFFSRGHVSKMYPPMVY